MLIGLEGAHGSYVSIFGRGMAGRYTGSYLDRSNGWRAVAILADIGQASLVIRRSHGTSRSLPSVALDPQPLCVAVSADGADMNCQCCHIRLSSWSVQIDRRPLAPGSLGR